MLVGGKIILENVTIFTVQGGTSFKIVVPAGIASFSGGAKVRRVPSSRRAGGVPVERPRVLPPLEPLSRFFGRASGSTESTAFPP